MNHETNMDDNSLESQTISTEARNDIYVKVVTRQIRGVDLTTKCMATQTLLALKSNRLLTYYKVGTRIAVGQVDRYYYTILTMKYKVLQLFFLIN